MKQSASVPPSFNNFNSNLLFFSHFKWWRRVKSRAKQEILPPNSNGIYALSFPFIFHPFAATTPNQAKATRPHSLVAPPKAGGMPPSRKPIRIQISDRRSRKWRVPLTEDVFVPFVGRGGDNVREVFGDGSLFSPLLFGKFFDPADAFPLWDFEPETLLATRGKVDWDETEEMYLLKAELPGANKFGVEVCVESGKVMEISRQMRESAETKDWRTDIWWEYGHVRRIELPTNADRSKAEAYVENVNFIEIRIPKTISSSSSNSSTFNNSNPAIIEAEKGE